MPEFFKYYTIECNGFVARTYYKTREEAETVAIRRHNISGQNWQVKEVYLTDPYADDDRPYGLMRRA